MGSDTGRQRLTYRMLGCPPKESADLFLPPGKLNAGQVRLFALIDDVIDLTTKRIQRHDGSPRLRLKDLKGGDEIRAAFGDLGSAVLIRRHALWRWG
jgi:hypothetical protein